MSNQEDLSSVILNLAGPKHASMDDESAKKIKIYEQYRRGEITEEEVRAILGNDVINSMEAEVEAFESAMERDTSVFFVGDDN